MRQRKFYIAIFLLLLAPHLQAHQGWLPIIFAQGVTLPNTKKLITPSTREVEEQLREAYEESYKIGFVHKVDAMNPWYGVVGTVFKQVPAKESRKFSQFKVHFDYLLQIHNPTENIKPIRKSHKNKVKGSHFCQNYQIIEDSDPLQVVTAFVHEFLLPRIPLKMRTPQLTSKLKKATSINQVLLTIIDLCQLEITEEQAVRLLEYNLSVQEKTSLVMELLVEKIQSSSGKKDDHSEIKKYQAKLETLDLSDEMRSKLEEMLEQYEKAQANPHESSQYSRYLKFAFSLPWNTSDPEDFDLAKVEAELHQRHFGMAKAKDRMIDHLALRQISPSPLPTIICLAGPPGVGKTRIVQKLSDSIGRKFARIALGGVSTEGDIRGHRMTYVGAMPGRILDAIKRAGSNNPVILLDEIDKMSSENPYHGDPTAALLEVFDPEQNKAFYDNYLDGPFDISKVIFIATANNLEKIPRPLKDRMEIIHIPKYSIDEKITIARDMLIPEMLINAGLTSKPPHFSDDVIRKIIEDYTFESGVRSLKSKINILLAKYARGFLKDELVTFTPENLKTYLGPAHGQLEEISRKAKEIEASLNDTARRELFKQLEILEELKSNNPERQAIKKYLSFFVSLPWHIQTIDNTNLHEVEERLHATHDGMEKPIDRILDYLTLRKHSTKNRAITLCLAGPPGVGKTSVCQEIAHALNKNFQRIALGSISTRSEISGLNRSFQGAAAGKILQAIARSGSNNPVIALDEIDKLGPDAAATLLDVLDPEQNKTYTDSYLNVPFDLSNVLFIATANRLENIPLELLDRMEIVTIDGYEEEQKTRIARNHILPRLTKQANLPSVPATFSDELIKQVIKGYTIEAGVRQLTTQLNRLIAKYARSIETKKKLTFDPKDLTPHLGVAYPSRDPMPTVDKIGVVNGLFAGMAGGGLSTIEVAAFPGKGKLTMTGQLGTMTTESVQAAIGYIRSNGAKWNIDPADVGSLDLYIHMPEAGVKKDGPSAGVAMITGIISAITKRKVRSNFAMTGEITLQGTVLPIGGVLQKLTGAHRNGMTQVIFPEKNRADVESLKKIPEGVEIIFASHIDQILDLVLLPPSPETAPILV